VNGAKTSKELPPKPKERLLNDNFQIIKMKVDSLFLESHPFGSNILRGEDGIFIEDDILGGML
jgi:hypothetical protein